MTFAIKTQCKEARAQDGSVLTKEGEWVFICVEPEGWVPATSVGVHGMDNYLPKDILIFNFKKNAEKFIKEWHGHPWYHIPNGTYEIIEVKPKMIQIQNGWEVV